MRNTEYIVKKIVKNRTKCIFISPHLDDAVLSCGGLILELKDKVDLKIINIFTKAGVKPETKFARKFVNKCGYQDSNKLFLDRVEEDKKLFKKLNIVSHYLTFIDSAWRKKTSHKEVNNLLGSISAELTHTYPITSNIFSAKVSLFDLHLIKQVEESLVNLKINKDCFVFCPIGTGRHVDHIIVRNICSKIFANLIYWSDFPYSIREEEDESFIVKKQLSSFFWDKNMDEKKQLIAGYKTQFNLLFPSGIIPRKEEAYFFNAEFFRTL